jgi:hypothetical protein
MFLTVGCRLQAVGFAGRMSGTLSQIRRCQNGTKCTFPAILPL